MPCIDLVFYLSCRVLECIENEIENNSSDSNEIENNVEKKIQTKLKKFK
jgi:hypothetical protein